MAAEESAAPQEKAGVSQGARSAVSFGSAGAGEVQLRSYFGFLSGMSKIFGAWRLCI